MSLISTICHAAAGVLSGVVEGMTPVPQTEEALYFQAFQNYKAPILYRALYHVCYLAPASLGILPITYLEQIAWKISSFNGLPCLLCYVPRAVITALTESDLCVLRDTIQGLVNQNLMAGMVEGVDKPSYDGGMTPAILVDAVYAEGEYLVFAMMAGDCPATQQRWHRRRASHPHPPAPSVSYDDLF